MLSTRGPEVNLEAKTSLDTWEEPPPRPCALLELGLPLHTAAKCNSRTDVDISYLISGWSHIQLVRVRAVEEPVLGAAREGRLPGVHGEPPGRVERAKGAYWSLNRQYWPLLKK